MPSVQFDRSAIRNLHAQGASDYAIAKQLGCSRPLVTRFRLVVGLPRNAQPRSYCVDHGFFKNTNSHIKAYWLGFVLADGCIDFDNNMNPRALLIKLSHKDRHHLEKCASALKFSGPIRVKTEIVRGNSYQKACLAVSSSSLCRDLVAAGWLGFKKSGQTRILDSVPGPFISSLMRGLFDGDGCFSRAKRGIRFVFVDMHEKPVSWYRSQLCNLLGLQPNKISSSRNSRLYRFQYDGNKVRSIMSLLYRDNGPFLSRKRNLVLKAGAL